MVQAKDFKIRCSAIGEIMAGEIGLTQIQTEEMFELNKRQVDFNNKVEKVKDLTLLQKEKLACYQNRQKNPELPQGAKTYCLNWIKEQLYQKRRNFSSKYTEKGIVMENEAIELCSEILGWGMISKNTQRFENDFMTGEPDVVLNKSVEDAKCSWDCFSFPLFHLSALPDYEWQLQGYMHLTGKDTAGVNYCLMDAPEVIVEHEARKLAWSVGEVDVTTELFEKVQAEMSYSHLPKNLRHKRFELKYNPDLIIGIQDRVELCRTFIDQTLKTLAA